MAIAAAAPALTAIVSLAGTAFSAISQYQVANAQAKAEQAAAQRQAEWQRRQALEAEAAGQRNAASKLREKRLAQSRLIAGAAASGGSATDATILDLYGDVEREGQYNARNVQTAAAQEAAGLNYAADTAIWRADANARITKAAARQTLIGGILSGVGKAVGGLGRRYGGGGGGSFVYGSSRGYGSSWTPRLTRYG